MILFMFMMDQHLLTVVQYKVMKDQLVQLVQLDLKVLREQQEVMVLMDQPVHKVLLEQPVP